MLNTRVGEQAMEEYLANAKSAGAELLPHGLRISGWRIHSNKQPILQSHSREQWEKKIGTAHLPEMVFGESWLDLIHEETGIRIHFNAFDALLGWKEEALPPVEVPAAAQWKFRSKPSQQVILDYDYTFTTPYAGSEVLEPSRSKGVCCQRLRSLVSHLLIAFGETIHTP